jgi:mRNA interferase MazF
VRGEVYRLRAPKDARGTEQRGARYAVIVQSDVLPLSTWLVAPTSTSARPASFRPEIEINGLRTRVLVEQTAAVDPQRLGECIGMLALHELNEIENALRTVLDLP